MALREIIGHEGIINILRGYIRKERLPHALLFAGDEGIGKRLTAINLAKTLNCHALGSMDHDIDCCDECPSCKKIDKMIHPDVFLLKPEGPAGQIKIDTIRKLQESLSYRPYEGRRKVAIIDDADLLNPPAANAFLSTLEEPPEGSIIILISARPDMLLETIRSRCQRLNFSPLPLKSMGKLIKDRYKGLDNRHLLLLAELAGGRLGHALNDDLIAQRNRSLDILLDILGNPSKDVWKDKKDMEDWFDWCCLWLRDIAVLKATANPDLLINKDKEVKIRELSNEMELEGILKLSREIYNIKRLLNFNLNRPITLYYINLLFRQTGRKIEQGGQFN